MPKKSLLEYRIEEVENRYKDLDVKVDLILSNHLPHIQESISRLVTRVNVASIIQVGSALAVIGSVIALVNGAK